MLEGDIAIVPPVNPFHYIMESSSGSTSLGLWSGTYQTSRDTTGRDSDELSISLAAKSTSLVIKDVEQAHGPILMELLVLCLYFPN